MYSRCKHCYGRICFGKGAAIIASCMVSDGSATGPLGSAILTRLMVTGLQTY